MTKYVKLKCRGVIYMINTCKVCKNSFIFDVCPLCGTVVKNAECRMQNAEYRANTVRPYRKKINTTKKQDDFVLPAGQIFRKITDVVWN
jgi:predicted RNA-binding Zn-ribbon protein involved in translation (DUF1610 family)